MEYGSRNKIRVILADDHHVVRMGIRTILEMSSDIEVVGEATNGLEALQLVFSSGADVLLLDIDMPVMNGIEAARILKRSDTNTKILVLSSYDDNHYINEIINNVGAAGYLTKDEAPLYLIRAVIGVSMGVKGWLSDRVKEKMGLNRSGYPRLNETGDGPS